MSNSRTATLLPRDDACLPATGGRERGLLARADHPIYGSPAVPVGRVRRPNGRHTASRRTRRSTGACSWPTRGHRPRGKRSACYQAGCARATLIAIQRSGAGQSRTVRQDRAQRAAQRRPLTARRSVATRCRSSTRRDERCNREMPATTATWAASWAFTDPREQQERPICTRS
jgi:hypothetical protein